VGGESDATTDTGPRRDRRRDTSGGLTLLYALALATVVALFYSNTRIYLDELSEVRDEDGD
jgi:hypothetical protein